MGNREGVVQRNVALGSSAVGSVGSEPRDWTRGPGLNTVASLLRHPAEFCSTVANAFPGELVRIRVGLGSFALATDPAHVEHILVTNESNYWKGDIFNTLRPIFGGSLLLAEGADWRNQRRIMQPYFRVARLRSMGRAFERIIEDAITGWEDRMLVDVDRTMRRITLRIILHAMFSSSVCAEDVAAIEKELERVLRRAPFALFSWWAPAFSRSVLRGPAAALDRLVLKLVDQRRAASERPDDLLSTLLVARHADGSSLSDREIRDHVVTMIFGGYEATATALHWMWLLLGAHPDVRARVDEEIERGDEPDELQYVQQVIDETLRLFPPFWSSFRTAYGDDRIGRYTIAAGRSVLISPYAVHRQPRYWPEPSVFDPDRFGPGKQLEHACAYLPFLRGPRMCIGKHFAELEMRLVTKVIGRRWLLDLPQPGWTFAAVARGSLRPRNPPALQLRRR